VRVRRSRSRSKAANAAGPSDGARFTLVSFHAHPDDEALLTAGTLARASAEGHRVVLVVATAGGAGLAAARFNGTPGTPGALAQRRLEELDASARTLGVARLICLDYADSGMADAPSGDPESFAIVDRDLAARRLADILIAESADVLTTYDPAGGYGHPDHIAVHDVGARAATLAATPVVLQATADRRLLLRALRVLALVARVVTLPGEFDPSRFTAAYTAHRELTHRVNVRRFSDAKRAAMSAHASQASVDFGARTLSICLRLPKPLFRLAFAHEWFVEVGRTPVRPLLDDVFASLRPVKQGSATLGLDV
jgi:LmbE family N-acetylglucosaminyl deacetylase